MFFTYLGRELRRRVRQASMIAIGLALGIGLVITVTALSSGVKDAQGDVLHSLYGVGTDITVSKSPTVSTSGPHFGFRGAFGQRHKAGTTIDVDTLGNVALGELSSADVTTVSKLKNVADATGGLTLTDTKITGKIPNFSGGTGGNGGFGGGGSGSGNRGGGSFHGSFSPSTTSVSGVDITHGALGPLSSGKLTAGKTFTSADTNADVALVDSGYATQKKLGVGSTVTIAKTSFKIIGVVDIPASDSSSDFYIPLQRAQTLANMKNTVNTIYVAAASGSDVTAVSKEISAALPKTTVTNSSDLAKELTGSISSASSLVNNLGRWLAIAVLAAAFLLAVLLTMSAVSRRVREFGTLKALGWRSRRVVGQVAGEALAIGIIGGAIGVGLGFLGSALVSHFTKPLTAAVGTTTGSATPGGAQTFTGPGGTGGFPGGGTGAGGFAGRGGFHHFGGTGGGTTHVVVHLSAPVTAEALIAAVVLAIAGGLIAGAFGGWSAARLRPAAALARVE
jgi:ABC-type antimicrobial peptide transport system permease subunit